MIECSSIIEEQKGRHNLKKKPLLEKGGIVKLSLYGELNGSRLVKILENLNFVIGTYKKACKKIIFTINGVFKPQDMFAYVMFECIIHTLIYKYGYEVVFTSATAETTVHTAGLRDSLLIDYINGNITRAEKRYKNIYERNHFRRITHADKIEEASILLGDLKVFFSVFDFDKEYGKKIATVVSELVDNACEHTNSNCLADIYVSDPTYKKCEEDEDWYYVINIVVLNFSNKLLSTDIKNKIITKQYKNSERYDKVHEAYSHHKKFFDGKSGYNEEDFFNLASFQDKISGRTNETATGGKGLTELIKSLEDKAEAHSCYVLSGKQGFYFEPEFLEYNSEDWIGFNNENDFFNHIPDERVLVRADINFLGTGYNFTLIVKKESVNNE